MRFDVSPDVCQVLFVSTPIGESILAERVYINLPITLFHGVTSVDLVELGMLDFDVMLGMIGPFLL